MYKVIDEHGNPVDLDAITFTPPKQQSRTKDEWLAYIETAPITLNQLGTIMHVFHRLGFDIGSDYLSHVEGRGRAERLNVISGLIDRDIDSINKLTQAEAGYLIHLLKPVDTIDSLYALLPADYWHEAEQEEKPTHWKSVVLVIAGIAIALS